MLRHASAAIHINGFLLYARRLFLGVFLFLFEWR